MSTSPMGVYPEDMERRRIAELKSWILNNPTSELAPVVLRDVKKTEEEMLAPQELPNNEDFMESEKLPESIVPSFNPAQQRQIPREKMQIDHDRGAEFQKSGRFTPTPKQQNSGPGPNKWDTESSLQLLAELTKFQEGLDEDRRLNGGMSTPRCVAGMKWTKVAEKLPNRYGLEFYKYANSCRVHFMNICRVYRGQRKAAGSSGTLDLPVHRKLEEFLRKWPVGGSRNYLPPSPGTEGPMNSSDTRGLESGDSTRNNLLAESKAGPSGTQASSVQSEKTSGTLRNLFHGKKVDRGRNDDSSGENFKKLVRHRPSPRDLERLYVIEEGEEMESMTNQERVENDFEEAARDRQRLSEDSAHVSEEETSGRCRKQRRNEPNMSNFVDEWDKRSTLELLTAIKNVEECGRSTGTKLGFNRWERVASQLPNRCKLDSEKYIRSCEKHYSDLAQLAFLGNEKRLDDEVRIKLDECLQFYSPEGNLNTTSSSEILLLREPEKRGVDSEKRKVKQFSPDFSVEKISEEPEMIQNSRGMNRERPQFSSDYQVERHRETTRTFRKSSGLKGVGDNQISPEFRVERSTENRKMKSGSGKIHMKANGSSRTNPRGRPRRSLDQIEEESSFDDSLNTEGKESWRDFKKSLTIARERPLKKKLQYSGQTLKSSLNSSDIAKNNMKSAVTIGVRAVRKPGRPSSRSRPEFPERIVDRSEDDHVEQVSKNSSTSNQVRQLLERVEQLEKGLKIAGLSPQDVDRIVKGGEVRQKGSPHESSHVVDESVRVMHDSRGLQKNKSHEQSEDRHREPKKNASYPKSDHGFDRHQDRVAGRKVEHLDKGPSGKLDTRVLKEKVDDKVDSRSRDQRTLRPGSNGFYRRPEKITSTSQLEHGNGPRGNERFQVKAIDKSSKDQKKDSSLQKFKTSKPPEQSMGFHNTVEHDKKGREPHLDSRTFGDTVMDQDKKRRRQDLDSRKFGDTVVIEQDIKGRGLQDLDSKTLAAGKAEVMKRKKEMDVVKPLKHATTDLTDDDSLELEEDDGSHRQHKRSRDLKMVRIRKETRTSTRDVRVKTARPPN